MTTATLEKKTYKTFTWQAVKKIAEQMNVEFYSYSSYSTNNGLGLRLDSYDKTEIHVTGYERCHTDNDWTRRRFHTIAFENFQLKLELWAIKNGITYELKEIKGTFGSQYELRIVEAN